MKYLKKFNSFLVNESGTIKDTSTEMNSLLVTLFSIFKSTLDIEKLFNESNLGDTPLDIYDFFTDVKSLLQLGESGIQEFANNMGVGENDNIISSILTNMYKDKFKREILGDLDECISYLNNNDDVSKKYKEHLTEFKKLLM